jgi:hypothetical protein
MKYGVDWVVSIRTSIATVIESSPRIRLSGRSAYPFVPPKLSPSPWTKAAPPTTVASRPLPDESCRVVPDVSSAA